MAGSGTAHLRADETVLRVEDLRVRFPAGRRRTVHAVSGVSFDVARGETLGIVGESGCGKSSAARAILQLPPPAAGSIRLNGAELTALRGEALRRTRQRLQMIFQDPISSLNPRRRVREIVAEGPRVWGTRDGPGREGTGDKGTGEIAADRIDEVLEAVGLDPGTAAGRRPHEFSGGQCQRISIARALALEPEVVICDEPVSALDVSVQAQILNLLEDLKARYGLTLVFIAHDLAVIKNISDRVLVMYLGKTCELAPSAELVERPAHPYTRALLSSVPKGPLRLTAAEEDRMGGEPPSPIDPPSGCRFRTRCPRADARCATEEPMMRPLAPASEPASAHADHWIACHHPVVG